MINLDKKYYWVGLGVILFTVIALITVNFTNSNQLQGNLAGTLAEYETFNSSISGKIKAAEDSISSLKSQISNSTTKTDAEKTELTAKLTSEESRLNEVKTSVSAVTTPTDENYLTANETLSAQLAILDDIISKINTVTDQLNTVQISCPLNDTASEKYVVARNFEENLSNVSDAIDLLGTKSIFGTAEEDILESLFIDLVVLIGNYEDSNTDCFVMSDPDTVENQVASTFNNLDLSAKVSTLNDTIEALNEGPIKCAKQLTCTSISNLETVRLPVACPAGSARNATGQCEPTVCPISASYAKFDIIYGQLQMFTTAPSTFSESAKTTLATNLTQATANLSAEEAALYTNYITNFSYATQANSLINTINGTINRYKAISPLCDKSSYTNLIITEENSQEQELDPNERIVDPDNEPEMDPFEEAPSCPVDSVYLEERDSCMCINGLSDVESDGTCPAIGETITDPDLPVEEPEFTCADGTVVTDLLLCELESSNELSDEGLLGAADDSLSLNSNTDPNVMYSATVQGETGLAPLLIIVFFVIGAFNLFIWIK